VIPDGRSKSQLSSPPISPKLVVIVVAWDDLFEPFLESERVDMNEVAVLDRPGSMVSSKVSQFSSTGSSFAGPGLRIRSPSPSNLDAGGSQRGGEKWLTRRNGGYEATCLSDGGLVIGPSTGIRSGLRDSEPDR
jgi:hypothetical protein